MADRIKGITVVLGGDTTGLNKALSGTNKEIKNTQAQLKDVERLLKLDPTNTTLLEQKQRLLADAVGETKSKLDTLKTAEKQVQEQFKKGDVTQQQYDALQREIVATEQALQRLEAQANDSTTAVERIGDAAQSVKSGAASVQQAFAPVTAAVAGLATAAVATIPATQELRSDLSKLDANAREAGVGIDAARQAYRLFSIQSGETDSAIEATSNLLMAGFTESNLQKAVEGLAGAAQRFPDTLKIESLADSLQETLATGAATGAFGELLDRLGVGADNFSAALGECSSAAEQQNLVLTTLAQTGLVESYNAWAKNNEEMLANQEANLALQESTAALAEQILPFATTVIQKVTELINWFTGLDSQTQTLIVTVLALLAAISPLAGVITGISTVVGAATTAWTTVSGAIALYTGAATTGTAASTALAGAITFLTGPIGILTMAIIAFVALIATKGDEIQAILQRVDDFLQGIFLTDWTKVFGPGLGDILNAFFANVKNIWDAVKRIFDGVIDFIRGVFTGDWERAWRGVQNIFGGIFDGLTAMAKAPINGIIGLLNGAIGGINGLIGGLNKISFSLPSWVPGVGGKSFGINIPYMGKIPYLAKGGILSQGSAIVGEAGPELLTMMGSRAMVQPLTSQQKTTNVGGINMYIYGAPGQDVNELADIVEARMETKYQQKAAVYRA